MPFSHLKSLSVSFLLFIVLICTGTSLSQHKLLWIDEYFTQRSNVDIPSYLDLVTLHFVEGNKCPLFYLGQKLVSDICSFHYPQRAKEDSFEVSDKRAQVIMRIPSNVYMSLALAAIFYYFLRFFSIWAAIFALAVSLVSPMVWMYWVEARPYSLWFLLTSVQLLLFCTRFHSPRIKVDKFIAVTHLLLILTTPGSIFQISVITFLLFIKGGVKKRQLIGLWLLPFCLFMMYYFLVPGYRIKTCEFFTVLFEALMPERLFVYALYVPIAIMMYRRQKESSSNAFFFFVFLLFLISALIMLVMKLFTNHLELGFFGFFSRYLIFLVPVDILMFSFAGIDFWRWTRSNFWIRLNIVIFLGGLVIIRGLLTYRDILSAGTYLHTPVSL